MDIVETTKVKMAAAIEHLNTELKGIRTSRANPALVEGVHVEVYGTEMRLKEVASITAPEARLILITPYDPSNSAVIGKAIEKANIGFRPIVDANAVRINIPPMDESMRKEMIKICQKKKEEAKVSIRNIRRDANELVRKQKTAGDIAEDMMKKMEKQIQDLTDKYCKEADDLAAKKEKEISTI